MASLLEQKKDLVCRAISDKHVIQFQYDGRARVVEPFYCGINSDQNYVLRGFQIRGTDQTKALCWRIYKLSEMSQLGVTQHLFTGKREDFGKDVVMTQVFCRINFS